MRDRLWGIGPGLVVVVLLAVAAVVGWVAVFSKFNDLPSHSSASQGHAAPAKRWALVLGGSMASAEGATGPQAGWVRLVDRRLHLPQVKNLAHGPVGYATSSDECGAKPCPAVPGQLSRAPKTGVRVVLVSAGRYDAESGTPVESAITTFFHRLHARYPHAQIIATNPLWGDGTPPDALSAIASRVRQAVTAVGGKYVEVGQPLSGRSDLVSSDGVHANDHGQTAIADAFVSAYRSSSQSGRTTP